MAYCFQLGCFIKNSIKRSIESPEQLEEMGINVYASVPVSEWLSKNLAKNKINRKESDILLAVENPADLAVEAIRGYGLAFILQ